MTRPWLGAVRAGEMRRRGLRSGSRPCRGKTDNPGRGPWRGPSAGPRPGQAMAGVGRSGRREALRVGRARSAAHCRGQGLAGAPLSRLFPLSPLFCPCHGYSHFGPLISPPQSAGAGGALPKPDTPPIGRAQGKCPTATRAPTFAASVSSLTSSAISAWTVRRAADSRAATSSQDDTPEQHLTEPGRVA